MLKHLKMAVRFLKFYYRASTRYNIHSPFVFDFVNHIIEDNRPFYAFRYIEILRSQLIENKSFISINDLGAGSHKHGQRIERRVSDVATNALSPDFQCQWLFRLAAHYRPQYVVEMGTSLGISTLYLAEGSPHDAKVVTLEGAPQIAQLAQVVFDTYYSEIAKTGFAHTDEHIFPASHYEKKLNKGFFRRKISQTIGPFEHTLPKTLEGLTQLDFIFIDGNHRYEPTWQYFQWALTRSHAQTIMVFDDIHWSEDMERVWSDIQQHPSVRLTIDLFWCGIVFFRNENREKEHFSIIKSCYKPLSWGFWG